MNGRSKTPSPCLSCTRVANPLDCENKQCKLWQKWFLARWALIHAWPRKAAAMTDEAVEMVMERLEALHARDT